MAEIAVKKTRGKGRKVTFSMKAEGLSLTNTVSVSMRLLDKLSSISDSELTDGERGAAFNRVSKELIGVDNWPVLLDWLEENSEDVLADQEAIAVLSNSIVEAVLPKAPASDQDKPSA